METMDKSLMVAYWRNQALQIIKVGKDAGYQIGEDELYDHPMFIGKDKKIERLNADLGAAYERFRHWVAASIEK